METKITVVQANGVALRALELLRDVMIEDIDRLVRSAEVSEEEHTYTELEKKVTHELYEMGLQAGFQYSATFPDRRYNKLAVVVVERKGLIYVGTLGSLGE